MTGGVSVEQSSTETSGRRVLRKEKLACDPITPVPEAPRVEMQLHS